LAKCKAISSFDGFQQRLKHPDHLAKASANDLLSLSSTMRIFALKQVCPLFRIIHKQERISHICFSGTSEDMCFQEKPINPSI
jgi:hypothetical protein